MFRGYAVLVLCVVLSACSGFSPAAPTPTPIIAYTLLVPAELNPGDVIPMPEGEVVLRVEGDIRQSNVPGEQAVEFDMALLESMGTVEYTWEIHDHQATDERSIFSGVLFADVLAVVEADPSAETLMATALDDYQVGIPMSDIERFPVLFATRQDNTRITLERYGPVRIVYPYHLPIMWIPDDDIYTGDLDPRWVWSVNHILVGG